MGQLTWGISLTTWLSIKVPLLLNVGQLFIKFYVICNMKEEAVNDFIFYSDISYQYGLIDIFTYQERMICLYDLLEVEPQIINSIFPSAIIEKFYSFQESEKRLDDEKDYVAGDGFGEIQKGKANHDHLMELYVTKQAGEHCQWEFYDNDADPHPSVPHGHGIQKTQLRLDPYTRAILEKQKGLREIGREKKKYIRQLWNDQKFRDYALMAIRNFINSGSVGKHYNWRGIRGISNPSCLPKRKNK